MNFMNDDPKHAIQHSWQANARGWTEAVRGQQIESRHLATDRAILKAVLAHKPRRVLDLGCGEGWLCRSLAAEGIKTLGVDASAPLIDAARQAHAGGEYRHISYDDLATSKALGEFDLAVCNFSLLEAELGPVLQGMKLCLRQTGLLLIQTVHPWTACGEGPYHDGWRTEHFAGMGAGFLEPMPWYFRTLASWFELLTATGWQLLRLQEPSHPDTGLPLSLLIEAQAVRGPDQPLA